MNWTQWDIGMFDFPAPVGPHPVVIISNSDRASRSKLVNVLDCTSQKQARPPGADEVLLNGADGFEWETFCRCDHIFSVERERIKSWVRPAKVTPLRQRQIAARILDRFRFELRLITQTSRDKPLALSTIPAVYELKMISPRALVAHPTDPC